MGTMDTTLLFEKSDLKKISIILGIALVIGIYLIATTVVISKDGVFYITSAKEFSVNPVKVIKTYPCGYPYLIFMAHRLLNFFYQSDSIKSWTYCAQAVSLASRLGVLAMLYFVSKFLVGSKKSFLAILVLVFLPYPARMGSDALREWSHLLFLSAGLLFFILAVKLEKRWFYGALGLVCGLGFIVRPECMQIVVYALIWLLIQLIKPPAEKSRLKTTLAIAILTMGFCIPVAPYMKIRGRILPNKVRSLISKKQVEKHEDLIAAENITSVYAGSFGDVTKGSEKLFERVNENLMYFFTLPALLGVYVYFKRQKKMFKVFIPACFIIFYLITMHLLYYDYEYISRRHSLPFAVMLVLFIPEGLEVLSLWLGKAVFKKSLFAKERHGKLFVVLLVFGISSGIPKLFRPLGLYRKGYITAAEWLKENAPKDSSIYFDDSRIAFYSERRSLRHLNKTNLPSSLYIVEISKQGEAAKEKESENIIEKYSGWVNPKEKRKRITIYTLI